MKSRTTASFRFWFVHSIPRSEVRRAKMSSEALIRLRVIVVTAFLAALFCSTLCTITLAQGQTPTARSSVPRRASSQSKSSQTASATFKRRGMPLVNKIWKVVAPADRAPGSIYIFLPNGTLLMTSCVETYRVATWRSEAGSEITITEDSSSYKAEIIEVRARSSRLRLKLRSENIELRLEVIDSQFVCPDLKR